MILRNVIFRWVGLVTEVAVGLLTTPLLVKHLGQETYGVWLLVMSTTGLFAFLDLGLASAVTRHLAADLARGEQGSAWRTVSSALGLYVLIAGAVAACYLGLAWWAAPLFDLEPRFLAVGRQVLLVMGLCTALGFFSNLFEGTLLAREQHHLVGGVEASVAVGRLGALYWALSAGGGLVAVGLSHALVTMAGYAAMFLLSRRGMDLGRPVRPAWDWERARALLGYGRDSLLINLGLRMRQEGPVLLTGSLAGPAVVPLLGVGMRLLNYQATLVQVAAGVTQPRLSAMEAVREQAGMRAMLGRSMLYSSLITVFLSLGAVFLAEPFILLWLGPNFLPAVAVIKLLLLPVGLGMALRPCEVLLYSIGRHRISGYIHLVEAAAMAGLCLVSVPSHGFLGAAASLALAMLLLRPWLLPLHACRQVGLGLGRFWLAGPGRAALAGLMAAMPLAALFRVWRPESWAGLLAAGAVLAVTAGLVFWLVGLDQGERRFWLDKLGRGDD